MRFFVTMYGFICGSIDVEDFAHCFAGLGLQLEPELTLKELNLDVTRRFR